MGDLMKAPLALRSRDSLSSRHEEVQRAAIHRMRRTQKIFRVCSCG